MAMNETAKHEALDSDPSTSLVRCLEKMDLAALSFIQLKRLHSLLNKASDEIGSEFTRRAEADNSGDTVRVTSPKM
jgi:hypothetical protein